MPAATPASAFPTPARPGARPQTGAASAPGPGGAWPDAVTFTGGVDGAEVSVGVQPGAQAGQAVILLRVTSPLLETVAVAYLAPGEADRLAAAVSAAAFAAASRSAGEGTLPAGAAAPGCTEPAPGEHPGHTEVTAEEGTPAADLAAAVGLVPVGMVLVDFVADVDVCLIFGPPAAHSHAHPPDSPAGHSLRPHPLSPWDAQEQDKAA